MQIFKLITLLAAGAMALPTPTNVAVTNRRDIMQQVETRDIQGGPNDKVCDSMEHSSSEKHRNNCQ